MKREVKLLQNKAVDSLILAIDHFNRPSEQGRVSTVLILLDHAFEMFLKAAILHRGGRIRERRERQTLGFDACVRKALTDGHIKFLSEDQALTLQTINGLRDAAQHHLLEVPERQFYVYTQAGVTLFADLLEDVFGDNLASFMPERVLPISTQPPTSLAAIVDDEVETIKQLLRPGVRRRVDARARLRSLAIVEAAIQGVRTQPSVGELNKLIRQVSEGHSWDDIFPGVAILTMSTGGHGIPFNIRITKKGDIPVHLVPEGTPGASVLAVRRVNELGYYALGLTEVAQKARLTQPRALAVIRHLKIQNDPDFYKEITIGRATFKRYSIKAVEKIKAELPGLDLNKVWQRYGPIRRH